jgi:D-beta-D-heptose 7-phosphate kinase/D-beta-D-heptose 1-phosphate adenosyltransferase
MTSLLPNFEAASVLVVGDVMLDRYWHGDAGRISPEAPVPVVRIKDCREFPGGAGNVALNIRGLGGKTHLVGIINEDSAGIQLQSALEQAGVHCHFQVNLEQPTITKLRILSQHQQLIRLDFEEPLPFTSHANIAATAQPWLADCDCVVLSDYGKGTLHNPQALITAARAQQRPILVDPKGSDFSKYRFATLLSPNRKEFEAVVGVCPDDQTLVERGIQLMAELDLQSLLITRGAEGMTLLQVGQAPLHLHAHAQEVYDVSGAGDTVIGTIAIALGAGCPLSDAVRLANTAAGIVVTKLGTATVSKDELATALHPSISIPQGVMTLPALLANIAKAKQHNERIVMTNGCFDILHAGHVDYLQKAKALGDRLIIAVNDDASIQRLKGPLRPIVPLAERMQVLAALGAVDWVVPFGEDTPYDLISTITPDILVKGNDYKVCDIAGSDWVLEHGGRVELIPLVPGCSTSNIVKKIKETIEA